MWQSLADATHDGTAPAQNHHWCMTGFRVCITAPTSVISVVNSTPKSITPFAVYAVGCLQLGSPLVVQAQLN